VLMKICGLTRRRESFAVCVLAAIALLVGCRSVSESRVSRLIDEEQERAERILTLPPAEQRAELHRILDSAETEHVDIHDACIQLNEVGDASSIPHLIRALRIFGDGELPLPQGVGIICTQSHCVDTLEHLTGVKVGISYASWATWWDTVHPGQPLDTPPNKRVNLTPGAAHPE
jgi:hypothetical protein